MPTNHERGDVEARGRKPTTSRRGRKTRTARPRLEGLEDRKTPSTLFVGAALGSSPLVQELDSQGNVLRSFEAFPASFRGGVNVALGDLNGDDTPDIIASTAHGAGVVRVFDGVSHDLLGQFTPYGTRFRGGVNVAFGQMLDGTGDIVTGTASGHAVVKVFDGTSFEELQRIVPYGRGVSGVHVASANLHGNFLSDITTAPARGGPPVVKSFDAATGALNSEFLAYDPWYRGGVQIATGDFDDNNVPDLVTAPAGLGKPIIRVWASHAENRLIGEFEAVGGGSVSTAGVSAARFPTFNPHRWGVELGSVMAHGRGPDHIAITPRLTLGGSRGAERTVSYHTAEGAVVGGVGLSSVSSGARAVNLASVATQVFSGYTGAKQYATAYNPTWPNWNSTAAAQLNDSDFFNDAFRGLWDIDPTTSQGRQDLQTIHDAGFNLVRLYNWGPSRGWNGTSGNAHIGFLDKAQELGMQVIVPVSDYFLGNDQYAWNGQNPDASYSFASAPQAIQADLAQFLSSVTKNGTIHPAVHSFSVGNELDLGIDKDPGTTAKLQRALWWVVNLQNALSQPGVIAPGVAHPLLTIPISNADQGSWAGGQANGANSATTLQFVGGQWTPNAYAGMVVKIVTGTGAGQTRTITSNTGNSLTVSQAWDTTPDASSGFVVEPTSPRSWFEIFGSGVTAGEGVPIGAVPAGPTGQFTSNVQGLAGYSWYQDWFYNSINTFQRLDGLTNLMTQYDTGVASGNAFTWSQQWPGEKLAPPLLLTELGTSRFNISAADQINLVADQQAQVATNVLKTSYNLMGYTIFEFNDEPNKNNDTGPVSSEFLFGTTTYNASADQSNFRNGTLLYMLNTGATPWIGGTLPNYAYPVYQLFPVQASGQTLLSRLKAIFSQV